MAMPNRNDYRIQILARVGEVGKLSPDTGAQRRRGVSRCGIANSRLRGAMSNRVRRVDRGVIRHAYRSTSPVMQGG
jgi:hypothetical protein